VAALAAGLLAGLLSLPGLRLPFLSDDWTELAAVRHGLPAATPLGDFRPLAMASLWLDLRLWGPSPILFHATQILLIACAAFLVARVAARYAGDDRVGLATGALFAGHPWHVENAAWIAARHDALMAIFFLGGLLAYDRWREAPRGTPVLALLGCEAALLSKESALAFPIVLVVAGWLVPGRRPAKREWLAGILPSAAIVLLHFAVIRPWFLSGAGRTLLGNGPAATLRIALAHGVAAVLPLDPEILVSRPVTFGLLGVGLGTLLASAAWLGARRIPVTALAGAALFAACLVPDVVDLQKRYLFLPTAFSCMALAILWREAGGKKAAAACLVIAAVWIPAAIAGWRSWEQAAAASRTVVRDLAATAADPSVRDIVIANQPFRVHGASLAGDFEAALSLSGSRVVPVHSLCWVSYETVRSGTLAPGPSGAAPGLRLAVPRRPYSRYVGPRPPPGAARLRTPFGVIEHADDVGEGGDAIWTLRPEAAPGRAILVWSAGRLRPFAGGAGAPSPGE
jgi:hypothetical protein